jgi:hypothetical protein
MGDYIQALETAHASGYTHGDLHSDNVGVTHDLQKKRVSGVILDWSRSKKRGHVRANRSMSKNRKLQTLQKCQHLAPEMVDPHMQVHAAQDVFSLARLFQSKFEDMCTSGEWKSLLERAMSYAPHMRPALREFQKLLQEDMARHCSMATLNNMYK